MYTVTFRMDAGPAEDSGRAGTSGSTGVLRVEVEPGVTVHDAARAAGLHLAAPCGGKGRCGRCVVEVAVGAPPPTDLERERMPASDLEKGLRLGCQVRVTRDLDVGIPPSSCAALTEILEDGECVAFGLEPSVRARHVSLEPPSLEDPRSDLARLAGAVGLDDLEGELDACRSLPSVLREHDFSAQVVLRGRKLLAALPPGGGARVLGAAFDIGTTTVAGSLVDLATGECVAIGSRTNPQDAFGSDVISRMDYAAQGPDSLAEIHSRIVACLNELLEDLARKAGARPVDVYDVVVAGNTVMTHLFLGLPPEAMATVPFTPVVTDSVDVAAAEVGLSAARPARVWTAPGVTAYVGGDVVLGMVAVGFRGFRDETIYIDIGTNGEVAAGTGERALCAATAAGPAFEGACISRGTRAVPGAISYVELRGDELEIETIGGLPPIGICGTGLVDLVASLLGAGVIDETGRIDPDAKVPLASRVREGEDGVEFVVAGGPGGELVLTQRDVRELQLAKGAIAAGSVTLLSKLGVDPADVSQVLLAGAFGSKIRAESALSIGLLPPGVVRERVRAVGNAAAAGARAATVSTSAREEATRLARWLEPVELSGEAAFQTYFAEAMMFPVPAATAR